MSDSTTAIGSPTTIKMTFTHISIIRLFNWCCNCYGSLQPVVAGWIQPWWMCKIQICTSHLHRLLYYLLNVSDCTFYLTFVKFSWPNINSITAFYSGVQCGNIMVSVIMFDIVYLWKLLQSKLTNHRVVVFLEVLFFLKAFISHCTNITEFEWKTLECLL